MVEVRLDGVRNEMLLVAGVEGCGAVGVFDQEARCNKGQRMRGSQRQRVDQADQQTGEDGLKREGVVVCKIWCVGCDVRLGGSGNGGMDGGMDYLAGRDTACS